MTPIESRRRSCTRPTPGSLRIDKSCMNSTIALRSNGSANWPFGLFYIIGLLDSGLKQVHSAFLLYLSRSKIRYQDFLLIQGQINCTPWQASVMWYELLREQDICRLSDLIWSNTRTCSKFCLFMHSEAHFSNTIFRGNAVSITILRNTENG